jgi:hypothetical protein
MTVTAQFNVVVEVTETGEISADWGDSFVQLYDANTWETVDHAGLEAVLPEQLDLRLGKVRAALNEALDIDVRFSELEDEVDTEAYIDAKYDAAELLGVLADLVRPFFARTEVQS